MWRYSPHFEYIIQEQVQVLIWCVKQIHCIDSLDTKTHSETQKHTETHWETHTDSHRETNTETHTQRDTNTHRHTHTQRHIQRDASKVYPSFCYTHQS